MAASTGNSQLTMGSPLTLRNKDVQTPRLVYGTAWKKERSTDLVYQALKAGFKGVDTAAQPRHYREDLVAEGIRKALQEGIVSREDLYIQTKFTGLTGQDHDNMPYRLDQSLEEQVRTSVASSLANLTTPEHPYIDCLVLHSPFKSPGDTHTIWKTLEPYVPSKIRTLGISNTGLSTLEMLNTEMTVKPSIVQNRFHGATKWDVPVRKYCREYGILYQSFWTLTGNPELRKSEPVLAVAEELEKLGVKDEAVALYSLVLGMEGTVVMDGTKDKGRMKGDLEGVQVVGRWAEGEGKERWGELLQAFKKEIGEDL